jgi:phosphomannomutase
VEAVAFTPDGVKVRQAGGEWGAAGADESQHQQRIRTELGAFFGAQHGFGAMTGINYVDGIRMFFDNDDVAHVRPSGNAPQLRIYANADTQERAAAIVAAALAEPDGILRRLERAG